MPEPSRAIRIVIADDHPIFRDGLRRLLGVESGLAVVGEAGTGGEAMRAVVAVRPDVLLLDLAMPRGSGWDVLQALVGTKLAVRPVVLTAEIDHEKTVRALQLGARGVVAKEAATQTLYACIRGVMRGEYWVGRQRVTEVLPALLQSVPDGGSGGASGLTPREREIVAVIVEGGTNRDIAAQFHLSEQTVKNHLAHVFDKLGVSTRLELALYAIRHKLFEPATRDTRQIDR
jgi:DNA-binding NarL/FixJ family response regulator